MWMSILAKKRKHPEKRKKQQSTENQNNTKYQIVSYRGPVFTFSLPRGATRPPYPRQLHHC